MSKGYVNIWIVPALKRDAMELEDYNYFCVMNGEVSFADTQSLVSVCNSTAERNPVLEAALARVLPRTSSLPRKTLLQYNEERKQSLALMQMEDRKCLYESAAEELLYMEDESAHVGELQLLNYEFSDGALVFQAQTGGIFVVSLEDFKFVHIVSLSAHGNYQCIACDTSCAPTIAGFKRGCIHTRKVLEAVLSLKDDDDAEDDGAVRIRDAMLHVPVTQQPRPIFIPTDDRRFLVGGELAHLNMVAVRQQFPLQNNVALMNQTRKCQCMGKEEDDVFPFYKKGLVISAAGKFSCLQ